MNVLYSFTECSCFWITKTKQFLTDCSDAELTSVPDDIPPNTTHLDLNNNTFNQLRNNSFKRLVKLQWLDVSSCQIYKMEVHAFLGLRNLQTLSLKDNHLNEENNSYTQGVFSVLAETLTFLDISKNLDDKYSMSYPGEALCVNSLETLRLDCISGLELDRGFENLTNLTELDFSGGIQADYLPDDMFSSISNLNVTTVNFTNVNVKNIGEKVFSTVKSLRVLDFTNNPQAGESLIKISSTLNQTLIEELYMENTSIGVKSSVNQVIKNLHGTSIKILALDNNNIYSLNFSLIFVGLPRLENFTVTNNNLRKLFGLFETYISAKNLRKLDISYQNDFLETTVQNLSTARKIDLRHLSRVNVRDFCNYSNECILVSPEKLEWIAISHAGIKIDWVPEIQVQTKFTIKHVDGSGNRFGAFRKPMHCQNVTVILDYMDASNCEIKCMVKDLFEHCNYHMKFAHLSHNQLGLLEGGCNKDPMDTWLSIKPLKTLEILDLSYNRIDLLLNDTFDKLVNLRKLFLSNNKINLSSWKPNLTNLVHLEYLDLSYNNFQTLPLHTRLMLHKMDKT